MNKCRLCYTDPNPEVCQHIFNTKSEPPIWKIIEQFSNLIITKNDPYTKNICGQCFIDLVKYNDFRTQILATNYRIQHEKEQLLEKTSDNCDYFEVHFTSTTSNNDDFMIKEEQIEIEEDPLKIADEIKEELNNISVAVIDNQNIKQMAIVDGINNNDNITAYYTSPNDNSNETNERQSSQCSTDDKFVFTRDSTETDGSYTISTNKNDLRLPDNDYMITINGNEISTTKDIVGCSKNFENNSLCSNSNNDDIGKKEELNVEMKTDNSKKYSTSNNECLNVDNLIDPKTNTTEEKIAEIRKNHNNVRNDLNILKVHTNEMPSTLQSNSCEKPYRCDICKKQFSLKVTLCRHIRVHTGEKPFKCTICNKQFSQKTILLNHERIHTGEKPYRCNICYKQFSLKITLSIHQRVHTGEKPFKCNICNKQFTQKSSLWNHERLHKNEKPYKCNVCNKSFTTRTHLKDHLNVHTAKKPYSCNICNKMFTFRSALPTHLKAHRNEKEFECDICKKRFLQKGSLNRHLRTHTGEKPFKCNICNRQFSNKTNCLNHERVHSGEKPFKCDVCNRAFTQKGTLAKHYRRMHVVEKS